MCIFYLSATSCSTVYLSATSCSREGEAPFRRAIDGDLAVPTQISAVDEHVVGLWDDKARRKTELNGEAAPATGRESDAVSLNPIRACLHEQSFAALVGDDHVERHQRTSVCVCG
ncbi:hypothetical protein GOP47_0016130 [Adiantum capillus-veneris]|uniref:Uncharacterized protein n=1 Tax=Adiantum capillus-veneris TaxID=13818 RepID=A0A9D4UKZ4_ADICA|nr:hypothetical protein GOP47_0016130 [Adiantum capillus-veneris]